MTKNIREFLEKNCIDLDQYEVLKNIDKMIELNLEANEKLKQLKEALFLQKLTDQEKIYIIEDKYKKYFLSEENYKIIENRIGHFTSGFSYNSFDVAKFRLKKLNIE